MLMNFTGSIEFQRNTKRSVCEKVGPASAYNLFFLNLSLKYERPNLPQQEGITFLLTNYYIMHWVI